MLTRMFVLVLSIALTSPAWGVPLFSGQYELTGEVTSQISIEKVVARTSDAVEELKALGYECRLQPRGASLCIKRGKSLPSEKLLQSLRDELNGQVLAFGDITREPELVRGGIDSKDWLISQGLSWQGSSSDTYLIRDFGDRSKVIQDSNEFLYDPASKSLRYLKLVGEGLSQYLLGFELVGPRQ